MTRHYFVGKKTARFDAITDPLIVTTRLDGVSAGRIVEATDVTAPVEVRSMPAGGGAEHNAATVRHGALYRVEGVEYVPREVVRYVAFDSERGFIEADEAAFVAAQRREEPAEPLAADLPELIGTPNQVKWATGIRQHFIRSAGRLPAEQQPAAHAALASVKSARFFISRKERSLPELLGDLSVSADGETRQRETPG